MMYLWMWLAIIMGMQQNFPNDAAICRSCIQTERLVCKYGWKITQISATMDGNEDEITNIAENTNGVAGALHQIEKEITACNEVSVQLKEDLMCFQIGDNT